MTARRSQKKLKLLKKSNRRNRMSPGFVNKYYWPFQCPDGADVRAFYEAIETDGGRYPAREIPRGTVVYLTEGTEALRTATGMCIEALNWALPDEYDLTFSEQGGSKRKLRPKPSSARGQSTWT